MKIALIILVYSALFLMGCADESSILTSPDSEFTQQSATPNWIKLPADLGPGFGVETEYSAEKLIDGDEGGVIYLLKWLRRPGHQFGNFFILAKVKVDAHSFPDNEQRLFTVTMDAEYAYLNISPNPNTLYKHITVDFVIKGIDVSNINPDTFNFFFIGDGNEILETSKAELKVDYNKHKIKVRKAVIIAPTNQTPPGARYVFVR